MKLYEPQFAKGLDIEGAPPAHRTIIIASTPRSGSHMLGHTIHETGAMGVPFEYANPANLPRWKEMLNAGSDLEAISGIMQRRTTANGVFAIKLHPGHLKPFGGLEGALDFFPNVKVLRIVRSDLLKQAISMSVAQQTGVWLSGQESNGIEPRYDRQRIETCLVALARANARWDVYCAQSGISPLRVEYERLASDTSAEIDRIAQFLGISEYQPVAAPPTKSQASGRNSEWVERFANERGARNVLDRLRTKLTV